MLYLDFSAQPCFYGDLLAKVHSWSEDTRDFKVDMQTIAEMAKVK